MYSWFRVTNRDKDYSKDFLVDLERFCNGRRLLAATIGTEPASAAAERTRSE